MPMEYGAPTITAKTDVACVKLQKGLDAGKYQAIFASPEMCLKDDRFRKWLKSEVATEGIALGLIIDEAHCISQWGGDFRKLYALLDQLRGLLPLGTPVHGATATLTPAAVAEVAASLRIKPPPVVFPQSRERPSQHHALLPDPTTITSAAQLPRALKTMATDLTTASHFSTPIERGAPNVPVMRKFRQGKIRILVATEAVGMGADIPDIELVIQFACGSRRSIRELASAGGSLGGKVGFPAKEAAEMPETQKMRRQVADSDSESSSSDSSESEAEDHQLDRVATIVSAPRHLLTPPPSRPVTPTNSTPSSSVHSTPSKTPNANGKRPMRRPRGDGPAVRRKDHLQTVRGALDRWRIKKVMSDKYSETSFTPQAILPDPNLTTLASNARIRTVDDILSTVKPPWIFATRYGPEILALLTKLDSLEKDARTAKTIENREEAQAANCAASGCQENGGKTDTSAAAHGLQQLQYGTIYPCTHPSLSLDPLFSAAAITSQSVSYTLPYLSSLSISFSDTPKLYASPIAGNASKYVYL
ncbi:hypothetical protein C8J57DRAFT_1507080 [Mycena rebaudengoi]|nr:hypothetical protein C8J57DRAFT_1507080 [Mycena rebaudengoi]